MEIKTPYDHDSSLYHKWKLLILMSLTSLGCSFVYDIPQALQTQFQSPPINFDYFKFDMLYSSYSIPNIILPLFGGYLTKVLGVKLGLIIFALISLQGQIAFSVGVYWNDYSSMIIGRVLYAFGAESLYIAQLAMAVRWFSKKELTFILGWNNGVTYFANVINGIATPSIYSCTQKLWLPGVFGALLCVFSFLCAILLAFQVKISQETQLIAERASSSSFRLRDLKQISVLFWILFLYYILSFPILKGFTSNMNDQVHKRFGFTNVAAGKLSLLYYIQLMVLSPLVGSLTDKYGKRIHWLVASGVMLAIGHYLCVRADTSNYENYFVIVPLTLLGAADAIFEVASWSCMYLALNGETIEMGFGISTAGMNAVTVLVLMGMGEITDITRDIKFGYYYLEIFLLVLVGLSLALLAVVGVFDIFYEKKLNKRASMKEKEAESPFEEEQQGFLAQANDETRDLFFI